MYVLDEPEEFAEEELLFVLLFCDEEKFPDLNPPDELLEFLLFDDPPLELEKLADLNPPEEDFELDPKRLPPDELLLLELPNDPDLKPPEEDFVDLKLPEDLKLCDDECELLAYATDCVDVATLKIFGTSTVKHDVIKINVNNNVNKRRLLFLILITPV